MADDVQLTQSGVIIGTPEYMAPEQARGEPVDHRADLFSLGSVLYALCTGGAPFRGATAVALLRQVSDEPAPPVRSLNPQVPPWLAGLIAGLMAKDPADRFQSAQEVATLLEGYLEHLRRPAAVAAPQLPPGLDPAAPGLGAGARRWPRWRWLPALMALAGLALGLLVWQLVPAGQAPDAGAVAPAPKHLVFDFRKNIEDLPPLVPFGPQEEAVLQTDAQGLRITMPAGRTDCNNVGLELALPLRGDFDIDLGYEILSIGEGIGNPGAGVQMRVLFDAAKPMVTLTRLRSRFRAGPAPLFGVVGHDGEIFAAFQLTTMANGNEAGFPEGTRVRAGGSRGRMKVARLGAQIQYLVSDEGSPYHLIKSDEFGAADVERVRVFGFSGWGPVAVDVRLTDLVIDANPVRGEAPPRLQWRKAWLALLLAIVFLTGSALIVIRQLLRTPAAAAPRRRT
jgi:hypothetical protein